VFQDAPGGRVLPVDEEDVTCKVGVFGEADYDAVGE